jgi:hypothetical protein
MSFMLSIILKILEENNDVLRNHHGFFIIYGCFELLNMIHDISQKALDLIDYCLSNGRICPTRKTWNELWYIYTEREAPKFRKPYSQRIPVISPDSSFSEKYARSLKLRHYIIRADRNEKIDLIDSILRSLPENEWHYFGDYKKLI